MTESGDSEPDHEHVRAVARGGTLNLVGNIIYGAANFVLLAIVTNGLGAETAGAFIVAVAAFNILSKIAELGASTGLIRFVSRERALGQVHLMETTTLAVSALVFAWGTILAIALWIAAPGLAEIFGRGGDVETVTDLLRLLAPFLPFSALYSVIIQGTRGFDTMVPQICVEKIGKACAQPIAVPIVIALGGGVVGAAYAWAGVIAAATLPAVIWYSKLLRRARSASPETPDGTSWISHLREFWKFAIPRAFGQTFQVAVLWLDTLLVAAFLSAEDAGIYAAGSRYLLIGTFTAEAIMQVVGPRVSGLLTLGRRRDAESVARSATAWQAGLTWPIYIVVIFFAVPLLRIFGSEFVAAQAALIWLSAGMLAASVFGPADSVILMSGRSALSMLNAGTSLAVNIGANLLLIPRFGIVGAGMAWSLSLVASGLLPSIQARLALHINLWSRALAFSVGIALLAFLPSCVLARLVLGDSFAGLLLACVLGGCAFAALMWWRREDAGLDMLVSSFREPRPTARPATSAELR
ncbi:MAG: oligosaccharide flippase family protein [Acidimicrobiia bacterium]|nr:oligosaccharide flippase family protein [Acidimicrobiia bacterium]